MHAEEFEVNKASILTPVPRPNRADLRAIPLGAVMLVCNLGEEGVEFAGQTWTTELRDGWIAQLTDEDDCFMATSLFYIAPDKLAVDNLPVRDADDIVKEAVEKWDTASSDLPDVFREVVRLAREGMTVNPF